MKNLLKQLSKLFGYEVPEQQSPDLYYQLMALQVGTLSNPESKEQLKSIKAIMVLAEICEIKLEAKVKVQEAFLKMTENNRENQSKTTS